MRPLAHLRALQYFEKVAQYNHLGDAARELGVTPSAVSKIIGQLEEIIGVKLLQKKGTGIQTTAEGRRLASEISEPFDQIEKAVNHLLHSRRKGPLAITTVSSLASRWLIPNLNLIEEKMGGANINVLTGGGLTDLWQENVDMGLRYGKGSWPNCDAIKLFPSEEVCIVSASLFPDYRRGENLNPWEHVPVLTRPRWENWDVFAKRFSIQGAVNRSPIPDDFLVIREAVLNGRGLALLPPIIVHDLVESGQLLLARPEAIEVPQSFYLVLPRGKPRNDRTDRLTDILMTLAGQSLVER
jgi:LysR family glycine cleavage system transcriptional activator